MGEAFRCGFVALVGRPNVGKSTLLNRLVGQKLSITSRKPQTTRHRIIGIKTTQRAQSIYVDLPGLRRNMHGAMDRYMHRVADGALHDIDVVAFLVQGRRWTDDDELVLSKLKALSTPVILVVNQVDRIRDKRELLPHLEALSRRGPFAHLIPISALAGDNVEVLERTVEAMLPEGPALFPAEHVTDRNERFLAAEIIREKLMRDLGEEVPYAVSVEIEDFSVRSGVTHVGALIWVERPGQKAIVIGRQGSRLKSVGQKARSDLEALLGGKVFLELWVKVREGWSDDERALKHLGYDEA